MTITPEQIAEKEFSSSLRGFDTDEVNDFLEEVGNELARAQYRLRQMTERSAQLESDLEEVRGQLAAVPASVRAGADPDEELRKAGLALAAAQETAERIESDAAGRAADAIARAEAQAAEALARATAEADQTLAQAAAHADSIAAESARSAEQMRLDALARAEEEHGSRVTEIEALVASQEQRSAELQRDVADLEDRLGRYRTAVEALADTLNRALADPEGLQVLPPLELRVVVPTTSPEPVPEPVPSEPTAPPVELQGEDYPVGAPTVELSAIVVDETSADTSQVAPVAGGGEPSPGMGAAGHVTDTREGVAGGGTEPVDEALEWEPVTTEDQPTGAIYAASGAGWLAAEEGAGDVRVGHESAAEPAAEMPATYDHELPLSEFAGESEFTGEFAATGQFDAVSLTAEVDALVPPNPAGADSGAGETGLWPPGSSERLFDDHPTGSLDATGWEGFTEPHDEFAATGNIPAAGPEAGPERTLDPGVGGVVEGTGPAQSTVDEPTQSLPRVSSPLSSLAEDVDVDAFQSSPYVPKQVVDPPEGSVLDEVGFADAGAFGHADTESSWPHEEGVEDGGVELVGFPDDSGQSAGGSDRYLRELHDAVNGPGEDDEEFFRLSAFASPPEEQDEESPARRRFRRR